MIDWRIPYGCSRVILVRHAEPDDAIRGRCYGSLDIGLSPTGVVQASRVVAELTNAPIDAAYSSPRIRATQTIAALSVPTTIVPELREIDFGAFEGMTYEEAEVKHPEIFRCWMETPTEVAFPGGERYADVKQRVREAAARIRAAHKGGCALIVAHGGTLRSLLAEALRMADADLFRLDIAHASISILDAFPDGTPIIRLMNYQPG